MEKEIQETPKEIITASSEDLLIGNILPLCNKISWH